MTPVTSTLNDSPNAEAVVPASSGDWVWRNFIDGTFVDGVSTFDSVNPVDGTVAGTAHEAGADHVDAAVRAGRRALNGDYGAFTVPERVAMLRRIADGLDGRVDEFIAVEQADTGKPITWARNFEVPRAAANFRAFADLIAGQGERSFRTEGLGRDALNYVHRHPLGVVGVISPWNLPLLLLTWKVAPALACGNAVVAKPSEETPGSATLLAEVMADAGVPPGAFNVVHGFGPGSAGEMLTRHPDVDGITFTGETATGAAIMRAVSTRVLPVSFELGGKNPGIVFGDADLDEAVDGAVPAVFANAGQVCLNTERLYVHRSIFDDFVERLAARAAGLRFGWPDDPAAEIGPLISAAHRDKVRSYYELAIDEGANVITGGGVPEFCDARDAGNWVEPTVWTGLGGSARCVREEIFGPVCHIAPFDTDDEAIAAANDTDYGLAASIWTSDLQRGHRAAARVRAGIVWINTWFLRDLRTPFGGMGRSGIGREGGGWSLDFYSQPSSICVKL